MMWLLLFGLTALAVLLPMVPAIVEWARPSDVVPLHIDNQDALDPAFLARAFAARLVEAVGQRQPRLGRSLIAIAPVMGPWPLNPAERDVGLTRRVWHAQGDVALPAELTFLAEVAAGGHLRTAPNRVYRALWAGDNLQVSAHNTVLRWAHGTQVDVAEGCRLAGRISADLRLTVWGPANFSLLHAPVIRFSVNADEAVLAAATPMSWLEVATGGLRAPVSWDDVAGRGTCDVALDIVSGMAWRGDLVCRADLTLGVACNAQGSLKVRGALVAAAGCRFSGNLVTEGHIELGDGCQVLGSVISETEIVLGRGCVIGAPGKPATVAAPRIVVAPGVVVHGTVWAGEMGKITGAGVPSKAPKHATRSIDFSSHPLPWSDGLA